MADAEREGGPPAVGEAPPQPPPAGVYVSPALPLGLPGVPVPGVDPTVEELGTIFDIATARAWCGVEDAHMDALEAALGGQVTRLRSLVLIDRVGWDFAMQNLADANGAFPGPIVVGILESLQSYVNIIVRIVVFHCCRCGACPP